MSSALSAFSLKTPKNARSTPRTSEFAMITFCDDRHAWTDRNSLTGIDRQCVKNNCSEVFLNKITAKVNLKCRQSNWTEQIVKNTQPL